MGVSSIEAKLYGTLSPFFGKFGFELLPESKQFRRSVPSGFVNVILSVSQYETEYWVEVHFGCRNQQVEQIAQQFLGNLTDFRDESNTLVVSVGKFNDVKYFRYKLTDDTDIELICEEIALFFSDVGLDFLKQIENLPNVQKVLNATPLLPCKYLYNQTHRCFKGLVAARLSDAPNFGELYEIYLSKLHKQACPIDDIVQFERLYWYLLHYSAN